MNSGFKEWVCTFLVGALFCGASSITGLRAEETPPPAPGVSAPAPAPAPAPTGVNPEAQRLLEKQLQDDTKLKEEISAQAAAHLQAGKELYSTFDYEGAQKELQLAVQLDPNNEESRKLLMRVNDVLGVRKDRIRSATAQLYGEYKVAMQAKLVELDNKIDWARRYMNEGATESDLSLTERIRKYEQATVALERARELLKWMPVEVATEGHTAEVDKLLSDSRKSIKTLQVKLQIEDRVEAERIAEEQLIAQKKHTERVINTMVDQAKNHFETGKYSESIAMANQILEKDPTNAEANAIIAVAKDKAYDKRKKWVDTEYKHHFELNRERAERMNIPHSDYLIYPDDWHEIARRTAQESTRREEDPWKQEIRKKLSRKVSFEFVDTPLDEAIGFLRSLTSVNIVLDPKVAAEGANKTPITLRVQDMDMETALKWILRLAELDYDLRNQVVFITKTANLASNVELVIYDVRDLTTTVQDFPGPRIDLGASQAGGVIANPFDTATAQTTLGAADLATLIRERLLPSDFADPATAIEESGGKLVVMQRPETHEKIRVLLQSFRETQTIQVLTQVRFVDVTDGFLETIGVHFTGLDAPPNAAQLPNAVVDPLRQPSVYGLFPAGGGPGPTNLPSDVQPSPAFQFEDFVARPPFYQKFGPGQANPGPRPITLLRPRLDPNFPSRGDANNTFAADPATNAGLANAPAGFRRQWYSKAFGSPVLTQGQTLNLLRLNPLASALGAQIQNNPAQGALFQFRFLQSVQANAVLQAVRKDQTADQLLAPKLMQFNNQRAHVMVAQQRSYIADYDISGAVFDPVIRSFLVGVVLEVKPTVSNDKKYITLDLRPGTALELTPPQIVFITVAGNDVNVGGGGISLPIFLPNLELRSISTTVTVPDNGTMLFSGLISDRKIDAKSGVPFFSDLPIIGRFFSNNNKERVRRNLLVLVNSRVILFDEEEARL